MAIRISGEVFYHTTCKEIALDANYSVREIQRMRKQAETDSEGMRIFVVKGKGITVAFDGHDYYKNSKTSCIPGGDWQSGVDIPESKTPIWPVVVSGNSTIPFGISTVSGQPRLVTTAECSGQAIINFIDLKSGYEL